MKKIGRIVLPLTIVVLLGGCSKNAATAEKTAVPATAATSAVGRLSVADATQTVRAEIYRAKPQMNPTAEFPLKELTTPEVWDRLHVQVFAVTAGVQQDQAYIVHDEKASPLGTCFGGYGVMSLCVADLAGDGHPKLLFSYSWGSGMHRSLVGLWDGGDSWIDARPALRWHDLVLEKIDDQHVDVAYGDFEPDRFNRHGRFGTVHLSTADAKPVLEVILDPQLPAEVLNQVWK